MLYDKLIFSQLIIFITFFPLAFRKQILFTFHFACFRKASSYFLTE